MTTAMIHVIATVELRPGRRDDFLAEFRKIVPKVLAEEGCLGYEPTVDLATGLPAQPGARDDVATIVERWESLEHLKAHLSAPHMAEYRGRVKDMVVKTTLAVLTPA
jgi:quinol monooxygenase YgiN